MNSNSKNNYEDRGIFSGRNIFIVQLFVSLLVAFFVYRLGLLPMKFLGVALAFLAIINAVVGAMLLKTKKKTLVFSKILSLLLSLSMALGIRYIARGGDFLKLVTNANKDAHVISVVVPVNSDYKAISDVKDLIFGANTALDKENIDKSLALFETEHSFTPKIASYSTYDALVNDLMSGKVPVMLLSEAHRGVVEMAFKTFSQDTKVIGFAYYESDVSVERPNVNVKSDTYSIYVTGVDTYGPVSTVSRSDVNMIVTVSPSTNQVLLTSIPRDYHVKLGTIGSYDKLTHAGVYGVGESVATLEKLLTIKIDYYLRVNFSSVEKIVDSLGGVDVYSKYAFSSLHGNHWFHKGTNHMNGSEALGFVRERYSLPGGDRDRVVNQQELIKGILNKAMSPTILTNYNSILSSVGGSMQMSIPENDFKTIIRNQIDSSKSWEILQYSLDGSGSTSSSTYSMPGWNLYVMEPNYDTVNLASKLIKEMELGNTITLNE